MKKSLLLIAILVVAPLVFSGCGYMFDTQAPKNVAVTPSGMLTLHSPHSAFEVRVGEGSQTRQTKVDIASDGGAVAIDLATIEDWRCKKNSPAQAPGSAHHTVVARAVDGEKVSAWVTAGGTWTVI